MNAPEKITLTPKQQFLASVLKDGEKYAGILLGENGEPDQHIILLPGDQARNNWKAQMKWASGIGGSLPTRREQSLLFANLKSEFQGDWYWSSEIYEPNDAYAWFQLFSYGDQGYGLKYDFIRARAVRRLVIQ